MPFPDEITAARRMAGMLRYDALYRWVDDGLKSMGMKRGVTAPPEQDALHEPR